jgi:hypothetical protein
LSDEQLLARLAQLTELAKPLLAKRDQAISTAGLTGCGSELRADK